MLSTNVDCVCLFLFQFIYLISAMLFAHCPTTLLNMINLIFALFLILMVKNLFFHKVPSEKSMDHCSRNTAIYLEYYFEFSKIRNDFCFIYCSKAHWRCLECLYLVIWFLLLFIIQSLNCV